MREETRIPLKKESEINDKKSKKECEQLSEKKITVLQIKERTK